MPWDVVSLIFRYFNFIACGINLLNLWMVRGKVSRAVKIYLASFSGLLLLWGILQMAGGYSTIFFVLLPPNNHPLVAVFWTMFFADLWGCTVWVVWYGGAEELLRSGIVYGTEGLRKTQNIKLFFAVMAILFPLLVILGNAFHVFGEMIIALEEIFPN